MTYLIIALILVCAALIYFTCKYRDPLAGSETNAKDQQGPAEEIMKSFRKKSDDDNDHLIFT
jgi:hypothetical protein